jgi:hypothetical protein
LVYYQLRPVRISEAPTEPTQGPQVASAKIVVPSLQQRVEEAGEAMVHLTRRTADETMGQSRLLLPDLKQSFAASGQPTTSSEAQPLRDVQQGVSSGLEPVASSARRAVALFFREPPTEVPSREPAHR